MKFVPAVSLQRLDAMAKVPRRAYSAKPALAALCALMIAAASGCTVVTVGAAVASTAVGVATAVVDVGVGAAKVAGKVIGKGVDAITPSSPPRP
ncbi:MAG: hypothetical protein ABI831_11245 [Betaproteobacteria bacterium]